MQQTEIQSNKRGKGQKNDTLLRRVVESGTRLVVHPTPTVKTRRRHNYKSFFAENSLIREVSFRFKKKKRQGRYRLWDSLEIKLSATTTTTKKTPLK